MSQACGNFDVKLDTLAAYNSDPDARIGRRTIDKQFHGDLEATSCGEMLSAMTAVEGSAAYVAIERVSGTLHGRRGAFTLQHHATMTRGVPALAIAVVPDSGSGELSGLSGSMAIVISDGKHSYRFDYTLPAD
jgi:hypothetical protein